MRVQGCGKIIRSVQIARRTGGLLTSSMRYRTIGCSSSHGVLSGAHQQHEHGRESCKCLAAALLLSRASRDNACCGQLFEDAIVLCCARVKTNESSTLRAGCISPNCTHRLSTQRWQRPGELDRGCPCLALSLSLSCATSDCQRARRCVQGRKAGSMANVVRLNSLLVLMTSRPSCGLCLLQHAEGGRARHNSYRERDFWRAETWMRTEDGGVLYVHASSVSTPCSMQQQCTLYSVQIEVIG